jgi:hypothetical protein
MMELELLVMSEANELTIPEEVGMIQLFVDRGWIV